MIVGGETYLGTYFSTYLRYMYLPLPYPAHLVSGTSDALESRSLAHKDNIYLVVWMLLRLCANNKIPQPLLGKLNWSLGTLPR